MTARPDWSREAESWPNAHASRFVDLGGQRLHVQVAGTGPVLLLLHGAGGATHSWRDVLPGLARRFMVVAPDLPGHGFSTTPPASGLTLPGMAATMAALLQKLGLAPAFAAGHSAGAAILLRMAMDGTLRPAGIVGINAALRPFRGLGGVLLPAMARMAYWNPFSALMLARAARDEDAVARMLRGMGSEIDAAGLQQYAMLLRHSGHIDGALGMMANWDLGPLYRALPRFDLPLILLAGERDRAVTPAEAADIARRAPTAELELLKGLGHLAHEEDPALLTARIEHHADRLMQATAEPG